MGRQANQISDHSVGTRASERSCVQFNDRFLLLKPRVMSIFYMFALFATMLIESVVGARALH